MTIDTGFFLKFAAACSFWLAVIGLLSLLNGCATEQQALLLPRAPATAKGVGHFDHINQVLAVDVDGRHYEGKPIAKVASTSYSMGPGATTTTNDATALLLGRDGGQMRCDFTWAPMRVSATGSCVDERSYVYDLLIQN